jgi:hypothetical protein
MSEHGGVRKRSDIRDDDDKTTTMRMMVMMMMIIMMMMMTTAARTTKKTEEILCQLPSTRKRVCARWLGILEFCPLATFALPTVP